MEKIEAQLVLTQRVSLQPEAMKAVLLRTSRAHSLLEKPRSR